MATQIVSVTAHQSHWYDILSIILKTLSAVNPVLATFVPAPVEEGIQIATSIGPTVAGVVEGVTNPAPNPVSGN